MGTLFCTPVVSVYLVLCFASLELDSLSNEVPALAATANWPHPHTITLDKAVRAEGYKYSSLIGPLDHTDGSLCGLSHYESNSKQYSVGSISCVSETSSQSHETPDFRPSTITKPVWNLGYLTRICLKSR